MIVNKNDLTKLARVLVTYLGYMSIAFGLALPAYGDQGKTSDETCTLTAVALSNITTNDDGNPSSFAAGCGASAGTDGSIAIGDSAKVNEYEGVKPDDVVTRTDRVYIQGASGELGVPVVIALNGDVTGGKKYYVAIISGDTFYYDTQELADAAANSREQGVGRKSEALRMSLVGASTTDSITVQSTFGTTEDKRSTALAIPVRGHSAISLGNGADTTGQSSIAIGENARIGKPKGSEVVLGVVTRTDRVYIQGASGELGVPVVIALNGDVTGGKKYYVAIISGDTFYYDTQELADAAANSREQGVGRKSEALRMSLVGASTTDSITVQSTFGTTREPGTTASIMHDVPAMPAERAVAIGGSATVTGGSHNGIAIGADSKVNGLNGTAIGQGAMAGTNSVSLGQGVTAGDNEIRIGQNAITDVKIGVYNLGDIMTNSDDIMTNSDDIMTNSDDIMTNSADIATNSADIMTNSAGIAMSIAFAHLPSVSAGDKGSWGIGAGSFAGKTALAVGISYRVQTNGVIKAGVSSSGGETSFGVGFGKGF